MSKNAPSSPPNEDQQKHSMPILELLKKIKRIRVFEPSLGVLGFFFIAVCMVFSFFYLDLKSAVVVVQQSFPVATDQSERFTWLRLNGSLEIENNSVNKVDFLTSECDLFHGDWVFDKSYPLYQSQDCIFVDEGFRCTENGRPDSFYTKWRWQPKHCNLPRFDAKLMLEKLWNKRLVFVGDSIGRNQWESLLCMLSSAVENKDTIYEINGNPITKHKGFLSFRFKDYNCTIEYYRSTFLVMQTHPPRESPENVKTVLKLDLMDWTNWQWRDADVLIFNAGHWWNYEKTIRAGCYFQVGDKIRMEMSVEDAYRMSIETVLSWIHKEVDTRKTQVIFRTFAPVHFRGGDWKSGGGCHLDTLPDIGTSSVPLETWSVFKIVADAISARTHPSNVVKLDLLNVTLMTAQRKDGHSSLYYLGPKEAAPLRRQDCSHWCLPGVPDTWNELLYAVFLKHWSAPVQPTNSSMHSSQD